MFGFNVSTNLLLLSMAYLACDCFYVDDTQIGVGRSNLISPIVRLSGCCPHGTDVGVTRWPSVDGIRPSAVHDLETSQCEATNIQHQ